MENVQISLPTCTNKCSFITNCLQRYIKCCILKYILHFHNIPEEHTPGPTYEHFVIQSSTFRKHLGASWPLSSVSDFVVSNLNENREKLVATLSSVSPVVSTAPHSYMVKKSDYCPDINRLKRVLDVKRCSWHVKSFLILGLKLCIFSTW